MPAVLVHGVPETERLWSSLRSRLDRSDVLTLALPGFGNPRPAGFGATMDDYAAWLMDAVGEVEGPVDLVGHDWGAGFTLRLVSLRPDLVRSWVMDAAGLADVEFEWHEFAKVWQTPEAYRALLGVLRRHRSQLDQVLWDAPPDDPLWQFAAHWDVKVAWSPPFSGRVVDLPAALSLLRPADGVAGRCVVQVEDPLAAWNTGCWEIAVEGGSVTADRTSAAPHVACDIGVWSQLFFGDPAADALRRAGRLAVTDERGFDLLRALCPPALVWTNDGF